MRIGIFSAVSLLSLSLAACGGGGSKSSSRSSSGSSSTTSTPAISTTTSTTSGTAASDPAATARAQKLVLVQSDFPAGWTGKAPTPDTPEDKANAAEFSACMGMSGDDAHSADVKGDEFGMGSPGTQASSQAVIIKGEASYRQDVAALKGNKLQPCLQTLLTKALTKVVGTAPTNIQVTPLIVPTFGDVTTGLRMSASLSVQGQNLTVVVDALLIGKNKAEVTGTFTNIGQPFDLALEKTLIDKLGAKTNAS